MTTPRNATPLFKTYRARLTFQVVLAVSYIASMAVLWSLFGPQAH